MVRGQIAVRLHVPLGSLVPVRTYMGLAKVVVCVFFFDPALVVWRSAVEGGVCAAGRLSQSRSGGGHWPPVLSVKQRYQSKSKSIGTNHANVYDHSTAKAKG